MFAMLSIVSCYFVLIYLLNYICIPPNSHKVRGSGGFTYQKQTKNMHFKKVSHSEFYGT